jgi:MobA/MobL family
MAFRPTPLPQAEKGEKIMMLVTETGRSADVDARALKILMSANRTARRLMAVDRTIAGAYARAATLRNQQYARAARENECADRALAKEVRDNEIAPGWGRNFVVKMPPKFASKKSGSTKSSAQSSTSKRGIRAYKTPLIDRRGRVALYMAIKYIGFKSKGWRAGLAADHIEYILRELALELATSQLGNIISNQGKTVEEILACWRALEAVEEGYRANAKVQYRIVLNLPSGLDGGQRRELVEEFCERTFGRLGLPYVAAIHKPDDKGDQRNYHAHICFSIRPCERVGDHEWAIAEEKVNGLTDAAGLKLIRALGAAHLNRACQKAGLSVQYTHQTYAERGIDAQRQKHVGPAAMAAHDRGETVSVIEHNAHIVECNESAAERDRIASKLEAAERIAAFTKSSMALAARMQRVRADLANILGVNARTKSAIAAIFAKREARSDRHHVARVARIAHMVKSRLMHRSGLLSTRTALGQVTPVVNATLEISAELADLRKMRTRAMKTRTMLASVQQSVAKRADAQVIIFQNQARSLMLDAPVRPYRIDGDRLVIDLSAMRNEDRTMMMALDKDVLRDILGQRFLLDLESDRERERASAQKVALDAIAARARAAAVDEACRIIRDAPQKPYRTARDRVIADWVKLNPAQQHALDIAGPDDAKLQGELLARAQSDESEFAGQAALTDLLNKIERDRHYIGKPINGRHNIDAALLDQMGIVSEVVAKSEVQNHLGLIRERQTQELRQIAEHVLANPHQLQKWEGRWTLDGSAPLVIRHLVDDWGHDPQLQAALARNAAAVAPTVSKSIDATPKDNLESESRRQNTTTLRMTEDVLIAEIMTKGLYVRDDSDGLFLVDDLALPNADDRSALFEPHVQNRLHAIRLEQQEMIQAFSAPSIVVSRETAKAAAALFECWKKDSCCTFETSREPTLRENLKRAMEIAMQRAVEPQENVEHQMPRVAENDTSSRQVRSKFARNSDDIER